MRSLIDEHGVVAEAEVLSNDFIQTGWLIDLLDTYGSDKSGAIRRTTSRHWEALGDAMEDNITEFGDRLIKYISEQNKEDIIKAHCPLNPMGDADNISKHLNCYISTKPVEGSHLTTGHILEFVMAGGNKKYGICLSPACDMVPNQKKSGWYGRLGDYIPFIMVSLDEISANTALRKIDQNIFLFLNIFGEIKTFTFNPSGDVKSNPNWEQMFAGNKGVPFGAIREMTIGRLVSDTANLKIEPIQAKIVAQLRYEYALNLLQRLGISLTRIGLNFRNIKQKDENPEEVDG